MSHLLFYSFTTLYRGHCKIGNKNAQLFGGKIAAKRVGKVAKLRVLPPTFKPELKQLGCWPVVWIQTRNLRHLLQNKFAFGSVDKN